MTDTLKVGQPRTHEEIDILGAVDTPQPFGYALLVPVPVIHQLSSDILQPTSNIPYRVGRVEAL
jgi:hypothetical protein